ncbi:hypothetical protein NEOC95_001225 [Neochlamydia sp. AcF95]|nr:hypothetical protein [Neochlamydia sp. AcF95]
MDRPHKLNKNYKVIFFINAELKTYEVSLLNLNLLIKKENINIFF